MTGEASTHNGPQPKPAMRSGRHAAASAPPDPRIGRLHRDPPNPLKPDESAVALYIKFSEPEEPCGTLFNTSLLRVTDAALEGGRGCI